MLWVADNGRDMQGGAYESMYSCVDCGKTYMHKRTLKRHELVHCASKCFSCLVCGKQYSQVLLLSVRMQLFDTCQHCNSNSFCAVLESDSEETFTN